MGSIQGRDWGVWKVEAQMVQLTLGLTDVELERILGDRPKNAQDGVARIRFNILLMLCDEICKTFADQKAIEAWLKSSNPVLGDFTPLELIKRGEFGLPMDLLKALQAGAPIVQFARREYSG